MALATGCSSSSSGSSGGNTHGLHLTYTLWDPVQEVGYKKSIALLEKSHPGISVNVEQIPYPDYEAKLTSEFSSGSGPDVFWVNTPFLAQFEQAGVMLNLKPLISTNQDVSLFTKGKVAMDVEGDWFTQTIKTQAKFSFGVLPIGGQRRQPGDPAPVTVDRTQS